MSFVGGRTIREGHQGGACEGMDLQGTQARKIAEARKGGGRQTGASKQSPLGAVLLDSVNVVRGSVLVFDDEVEQLRLRESLESGVRGESLRLGGLDDSDGDVGAAREKQRSQQSATGKSTASTSRGNARDLSDSLDSGVEKIIGLLLVVQRASEGEGGLQAKIVRGCQLRSCSQVREAKESAPPRSYGPRSW